MAILELKIRESNKQLILQERTIESWKSLPDEELAKIMKQMLETAGGGVHDLRWLKTIIDWVPAEQGLPMTEISKWMPLAARLSRLTEDKEYRLTLTPFQVSLIWKRINSPEFKLSSMPVQFAEFMLEFQKATGKKFEGDDEEVEVTVEVIDG